MTDELLNCPFCGFAPDINDPNTFQCDQGDKWGYVVCCCRGPEVRTGYQDVLFWKQDAIDAWNSRIENQAVVVPAGWKLVPIEPTAEMLRASSRYMLGCYTDDLSPEDCYRAMLAASPTPPTSVERKDA